MNFLTFSTIYLSFILCILFTFDAFFSSFLLWKTFLIFRLYSLFLRRRGNNHFDVHFWWIRAVLFSVERWRRTTSLNEEMDGEVFVSCRSRHFSFVNHMNKVLFSICTLNRRVNIFVYRRGKGINRRSESIFMMIIIILLPLILYSFSQNVNCLLY